MNAEPSPDTGAVADRPRSENPETEILLAIRNVASTLSVSAEITSRRDYGALLTDRLRIAASEASFSRWMARLSSVLQSDLTKLAGPHCIELLTLAKRHPDIAARALEWLRGNSELLAMLALSPKDAVAEALDAIEFPPAQGGGGGRFAQPEYHVGISLTLLSPLTHGADVKAGNTTLFRRMAVIDELGTVRHLPVVSGNSVRGVLRDILADHLLQSLGLASDRMRPSIAPWLFHALYSGGTLSEQASGSPISKLLGSHGIIKAEGWRHFREVVPALSLFGCALEQHIIPGRMQVSHLRPVCAEWGFEGAPPMARLFSYEFLTRKEDREIDRPDSVQMIANTEVLVPGTRLRGGIDVVPFATEMEKSALGLALSLWERSGTLGAQAARGLGRAAFDVTGKPEGDRYEAFLAENKDRILRLFERLGGLLDDDGEPTVKPEPPKKVEKVKAAAKQKPKDEQVDMFAALEAAE